MHMQRILWSFSHKIIIIIITTTRWGYYNFNCHGKFIICKRNEGIASPIVIENIYDLQTK
jgi:hypothetical protein